MTTDWQVICIRGGANGIDVELVKSSQQRLFSCYKSVTDMFYFCQNKQNVENVPYFLNDQYDQ